MVAYQLLSLATGKGSGCLGVSPDKTLLAMIRSLEAMEYLNARPDGHGQQGHHFSSGQARKWVCTKEAASVVVKNEHKTVNSCLNTYSHLAHLRY